MAGITVKTYAVATNGHHRDVLHWWDLTGAERQEFDYHLRDTAPEDVTATFFRYRGSTYDLTEFEVAPDGIRALGFNGVQTQSHFDCVAVRLFDADGIYHGDESVVAAHIHW